MYRCYLQSCRRHRRESDTDLCGAHCTTGKLILMVYSSLLTCVPDFRLLPVKGGSKGGEGMGAMPPQDAEVAFWSTAIILIQ